MKRSYLLAILALFMTVAATATASIWSGALKDRFFGSSEKAAVGNADKKSPSALKQNGSANQGAKSGDQASGDATAKTGATGNSPSSVASKLSKAVTDGAKTAAATAKVVAGGSKKSPFDVIRIEPNGSSVFAGLAKPNTEIVVLADGKETGKTKTDSTGNWVLITERKIENPNAKFTIALVKELSKKGLSEQGTKTAAAGASSGSGDSSSARANGTRTAAVKPSSTGGTSSKPVSGAKTVAEVKTRMIAKLEGMVDAANTRNSQAGSTGAKLKEKAIKTARLATGDASVSPGQAASAAKSSHSSGVASGDASSQSSSAGGSSSVASPTGQARSGSSSDGVAGIKSKAAAKRSQAAESKVALAAPSSTGVSPSLASGTQSSGVTRTALTKPTSASVPIPIQFEYRKAEFTEEGRRAVDLLSQYLQAGQIKSAVLSGHADDRGSQDLNFELSDARLRAVDRYVRDKGYTGELILHPRGETEPFSGVDRSKFTQEQLYQIDRRVELHVK